MLHNASLVHPWSEQRSAVSTQHHIQLVIWVKQWLFLFVGRQPQSHGASPVIWDHTVLPATQQVNVPRLKPARKAGTLVLN